MAEQMKPSGIDWIGDIPESWKVRPLKYLAKCNQDVLLETTAPDYSFRYVDIGSVTYERGITGYQELRFEDSPSRARRKVSVGDTIISTVRTYLKAIAIISDSENVIVSTGFAVYTPDEAIYPQYLYYFCKSEGFVQEIDKNSYGIAYPAINTDLLSRICIAYPCFEEQQAIADFLDKECAQIDSIAADLAKQISLLQQYKKSLITETVTKGLDKSVPMKDSGVEWIGEIPTHWDKKRMKYFLSVSSGEAITNDQLEDGEYPVYGGGKQMGYFNKANVDKNQILIGRVGANCGCVTITHTPSWATDNALVVQTLCYFKYIYYILISADLNRLNEANAQPLITGAKVGNCVVPFTANYTEQKQIAQYLDERCEKIEGLIIGKQKQLETIIQHKKSLIYEYVTGKKRVKEVQ